MNRLTITILATLAIFTASTAFAVVVPVLGGEDPDLQEVLDGITVAPTSGDSSVNVQTDALGDGIDSYWSITGAGGSVSTMIIEVAGWAGSNLMGVYDSSNTANMVELFAGADSSGDQAVLSIKLDGSVFVNFADTGVDFGGNLFGFYMTNQPGATFYSDTGLNGDGYDHMLAYQGTNTDTIQIANIAAGIWTDNEFILAWEDTANGGDQDYQDMVVIVESVTPVPEPATMLLLGSGLCGLVVARRRRRRENA